MASRFPPRCSPLSFHREKKDFALKQAAVWRDGDGFSSKWLGFTQDGEAPECSGRPAFWRASCMCVCVCVIRFPNWHWRNKPQENRDTNTCVSPQPPSVPTNTQKADFVAGCFYLWTLTPPHFGIAHLCVPFILHSFVQSTKALAPYHALRRCLLT